MVWSMTPQQWRNTLIFCPILTCAILYFSISGSAPNASANASDVCRAAIAVLFGRDVQTISVTNQRTNVLTLRYTRPDDGTVWINRCKLDGDRVLWAADQSGRWRNHKLDEILTFAASGKNVSITMTYSDGSSSTQKFNMSQ